MYTFNPSFEVVEGFKSNYSDEEIKNEPMFFNSTVLYAFDHGGPITKGFLYPLLEGEFVGLHDVFDSRAHMLMPGWFPCIPGWHHDDVPRGEDGQPQYDEILYFSRHILGMVNADIAPTEFLISPISLPKIEKGKVYGEWNKMIQSEIYRSSLEIKRVESGKAYHFDADTFHRGVPAIKNGWRWFGRVSCDTHRKNHTTNEIRKQVQVYLPCPEAGW